MFSEVALAAWTGAGLVWWILAWRLVAADKSTRDDAGKASSPRSLSVFKPLPPLREQGIGPLAAGLESFLAQLDSQSELLLGVHEADRDATAPFLDRMRKKYSEARIKIIYRAEADIFANPKIAWQKILAPHAEGELWLWSDADIVAPASFLHSAQIEFERSGAAMLTFPYVVREIPAPPALLEALFVNAEFYPGVLLLRKRGPVDFGLGAAMLFRRDDFLRRVDWNELGSRLADDFFLGQALRPVRVGNTTLTTVAGSATWRDALRHDLRWARTIRWNRPAGSLARIVVLPVMGWVAYAAAHPSNFFAWLGLLGMIQADVFFAAAIGRRVGCRMSPGDLLRTELWSLWRITLWLICWLPWPVSWSGKVWRGPKTSKDA
jgi:ceramide glucosyltransferase